MRNVHTVSMLVCMNIHTAAVWVGIMKARVLRVCAWCVCMCVCVCVYYSISHDSACVSRQEVVVIIDASLNLFVCSCSSAV